MSEAVPWVVGPANVITPDTDKPPFGASGGVPPVGERLREHTQSRIERGLLFVEREELTGRRKKIRRDIMDAATALEDAADALRGARENICLPDIEAGLSKMGEILPAWREVRCIEARLQEIEALLYSPPNTP